MGTSIVVPLIKRLVVVLSGALTDVSVINGDSTSSDFGKFLMVGWDDPDNDRATSAEGRQEWAGLGARSRYEEGTVTCLALAWDGESDLDAVQTSADEITIAVEDALRTDPNLGGVVPGLMWTGYGTRTELIQLQATDGACVMCVFDIAFKARI